MAMWLPDGGKLPTTYSVNYMCLRTTPMNLVLLPETFRTYELGAGGKPSTWLPPGRLVEHNEHLHGAVTNHCIDKENKTKHNNQQRGRTNTMYDKEHPNIKYTRFTRLLFVCVAVHHASV